MYDPWVQSVGRGRCSAFSLVEMVMVILIVGTLASIAVPRYSNALVHYQAEAAAKRLAVDLNYARRHAIHTNADQTVTFNTTASTYELVGIQDFDQSSQPYVVRLSDSPYRAKIRSADFGGDMQVVFDIYGVPDSSGQVVVESGDWQKTVTVDAENGVVTVQ